MAIKILKELRNLFIVLSILFISQQSFAQCAGAQSFTATPAPTAGTYPAGTTVTFCYTMIGFTQTSSNWINGFAITLGPGWNASTLTPTLTPTTQGSSGGQWGYYNTCTGTGSGLTFGPGFYFDTNLDGNPGNDFGDYVPGNGGTWNLCFSVQVSSNCNNQSLSVSITAMGDGTCGSWTLGGCAGVPFSLCSASCTTPCTTILNATAVATTCGNNNGSANVGISGGTSPYTISWNPGGATTAAINGLAAGNYTVSVTDATNCTVTATVNVSASSLPIISVTPAAPTVCPGSGVMLTANGASTYSWSPATGLNATNLSVVTSTPAVVTTYTVTGTDVNGCQNTATVTVNLNTTPTSSFTIPATACAAQSATVTYTGNAPAGATYNWNWNGGTVVSGSGQGPYQISWASAGNYNVTLQVVDNGCTSTTTTQSITVNAVPTANFTAVSPVCAGTNTTLTYTGTGTAAATYNWNFNGGNVASGNAQGPYQVNWTNGGSYNVTLNVTENGCTSTQQQQTVVVTAVPTSLFTTNSPICGNQPLAVTYTGNGTASAVYNWNFNGGTVNSGSGLGPYAISFANPGNYNITLDVSENGCTSPTTSVPVTITAIPSSTFSINNHTVCSGDVVTITYTGGAPAGATYNWNFGGGTVQSGSGQGPYNVQFNTTGNAYITLSVTDVNCTSTTTTDSVLVNAIPTVSFSGDVLSGCDPLSVNFTDGSTGASIYSWDFGDGTNSTIQNPTHTFTTGTYNVSLTVINAMGCSVTSTINNYITVVPQPVAQFSVTPNVNVLTELQNATYSFLNSSGNATNYMWYFGNGDSSNAAMPTYTYTAVGNYTVTLVASNNLGCNNSFSLGLLTVIPNANYFIPNAFTPNGDGVNETFNIEGVNITSTSLQIFDRWGELLFSSSEMNNGWDGSFNNKPMQGGVYLYKATITFTSGEVHETKGSFTLLR